MFRDITTKGIVEVTDSALQGMIKQFIKSKNIEDVVFIGFKKSNGNVIKGITKLFSGEAKKDEEFNDNKLTFDLDFQVTKIHPLHTKGKEIQTSLEDFVCDVLGVNGDQVEVNVYFTIFQEEIIEETQGRTLK